MAGLKERFQNPAVNDTVRLRLFTYNSNNFANLVSIDSIDIYFLDPHNKSDGNPDGRRLIQTIDSSLVVNDDTGHYYVDVVASDPLYTIGDYVDIWTINVDTNFPPQTIENQFKLYPQLWYTTPIPVVYDFSFHFQPNKFRKGSKQYILIEIVPNVPKASDLCRYYENLAIVSDLKISIQQTCGPCVPEEEDLRMIVTDALVDYREKRFGYYQLDTAELDCGIYDIWFTLELGTNTYISDRFQFQVYT